MDGKYFDPSGQLVKLESRESVVLLDETDSLHLKYTSEFKALLKAGNGHQKPALKKLDPHSAHYADWWHTSDKREFIHEEKKLLARCKVEHWDSGPCRYVSGTWDTLSEDSDLKDLTQSGIMAPITTLTSADSICHLAEELENASRLLPRVMVAGAASNSAIVFALLILILYRAGDIQAAVNSTTGQPYIEILLNATQSVPGTAVHVAYMVLALIFCATNLVTTSSRQLFSFARDHGVPFSHSLSQVFDRYSVPIRAIGCTITFTVILSLILFGSSLAFNIMNTLFGVALLGSSLVSISTLLFFPATPSPTVQTVNWAVLIFSAVITFALGSYFMGAKHIYGSPSQIARPEDEIEMSPSCKEEKR
ncbi:hypothetical protein LTR22_019959 [Elasticomyces elasticus]|nr:hypothetical protein LTR22_019959 [Elasticomyces elasticus]